MSGEESAAEDGEIEENSSSGTACNDEISASSPAAVRKGSASSDAVVDDVDLENAAVIMNNDDGGADNTVDTLRGQLARALEEKNAISNELASILRKEIDGSLEIAELVIGGSGASDHNGGQNNNTSAVLAAELEDALCRTKALFEENLSLKRQLVVARGQLEGKNRLESEISKIKGYWKSLNKLLPSSIDERRRSDENHCAGGEEVHPIVVHHPVDESAAEKIAELAQRNQELREENERLVRDSQAIGAQNSVESNRAKEHITYLQTQIERLVPLSQEILRLKNENARLVTELDRVVHSSNQDLNRLQLEKMQLTEDAGKRCAELAQQLESAKAGAHAQLETIEHMRSELARVELEARGNFESAEKLHNERNKIGADYVKLKRENGQLVGQIVSANKNLHALEEQNRALADQNRRMREEECESHAAAVRKIAADFDLLKSAYQNMKRLVEEMHSAVSSSTDTVVGALDSSQFQQQWAKFLSRKEDSAGNGPPDEEVTALLSAAADHQSADESNVIISDKQQLQQVLTEKEEWRRKYEDLRRKMNEARSRRFGVGRASERKKDDRREDGAIKGDTKPILSTGKSPPKSHEQRALMKTADGMDRIRTNMWSTLRAVPLPFAVYAAANSAWDTMSGVIHAVARENIQLRSQMRRLHRCIVAAKRRRLAKKLAALTPKKSAKRERK